MDYSVAAFSVNASHSNTNQKKNTEKMKKSFLFNTISGWRTGFNHTVPTSYTSSALQETAYNVFFRRSHFLPATPELRDSHHVF